MDENNVIDLEKAKQRKRRPIFKKEKDAKTPPKASSKWKLYFQFVLFLILMAYLMKECGRS
ncbi:MAG: hypothetical protein AB7T49_08725 [Oligoflexales bacterium]